MVFCATVAGVSGLMFGYDSGKLPETSIHMLSSHDSIETNARYHH